uniref:Ion transport domain-containing protein n=1 Tax=Globisporangium ultimum (strain ATCC 200006 / CBS 805.95 / DAOM BR144) TaxID=431595 RepID=K3X4P1_GLOUD
MVKRLATRLKRSVKRRMKGESHRQWMERNLHDSEAGILLDIVQSLVSLLMVVSIIDQNWTRSNYTHKGWYQVFDGANLLSIAINFSLRLYAASNRKGFFLQWLSLIDMLTAIPLFLQSVSMTMQTDGNRYLFRFLLMLRTIRILQLYRLLRLATTAKARQAWLIGLTIMCIIICAAVTFQTIEYCDPAYQHIQVPGVSCQNLSFLDAIYFVCITIGTVGFGDIVPLTKSGKMIDILLIVIAGTAISTQLGEYTDILSRETAFDKKYDPDKRIQHILLCGEIENGALRFFLHNWLHTEGERGNRKRVVILSPTLPSTTLRRILIQREYEQRVVYLQGSAMVAADLQRAAAPTAAYCFVMVKKHSETLDQNDTAANLLTCSPIWVMQRAKGMEKYERIAPLYVQVSKFDNIRHANISGASSVVCLEQLRLAMVAKSLLIKGFNTFLGNLVQRFGTLPEKDTSGFWLANYLSGCSHRVYETGLPQFLDTLGTFKALAILIYREFNVPIIGLRSIEETAVLFPADKAIADVSFQSILILSHAKDIAHKIEKMTPSVLQRHADLFPDGHGPNDEATRGGMTGFLNAMEDKLPFRSMSIAFVDDSRRSVQSARGLRSSTRSLQSNGRQNSKSDKITPLQSNEDYGDAKSMHERGDAGVSAASVPTKCKSEKRVSIVHFSALIERGASVTEDDESVLHADRGGTRTASVRWSRFHLPS